MRTTVNIDERLLEDARDVVGVKSPSEVVNLGLAALVREQRRRELIEWVRGGKLGLTPQGLRRLRRPRATDAG
ncbi:MAG: type II toxin-antitoxin system VapB family antitoxin [Myxococcales bacterium]|nr:type II toxin-antitoxin system VapB family antitoxin [Myxococcales bacterium]